MTDTTTAAPPKKQGYGKAGAGLFATFLTNEAAPMALAYLQQRFPTVNPDTLVDFLNYLQCVLIGGSVYFTPHNFVLEVKNAILFARDALRQWKDAWNGKPD